jgi:hypothetical protein
MSARFDPDKFDNLPLFAQVLIAVRMVRRAALALSGTLDSLQNTILEACGAIEQCAFAGDGLDRAAALLDRAGRLRDGAPGTARFVCESVWWAIDAARAAQAANDFPVDATVTSSARKALGSLAEDPRVSRLQLAILVASDVDQVCFACGEARIGRYDGLTSYVRERLAPVSALTLTDPLPSPEDLAR